MVKNQNVGERGTFCFAENEELAIFDRSVGYFQYSNVICLLMMFMKGILMLMTDYFLESVTCVMIL